MRIYLSIAFVGIGVLFSARQTPPVLFPDFPLYAGDLSPREQWCDWTHGINSEVTCQMVLAGLEVFYVRDLTTNRITSISYRVHNIRLGDLLLRWGTPTAQTRCGALRRIMWGTRSVLVYGAPFTPNSDVWFITFSAEEATGAAWQGFRH